MIQVNLKIIGAVLNDFDQKQKSADISILYYDGERREFRTTVIFDDTESMANALFVRVRETVRSMHKSPSDILVLTFENDEEMVLSKLKGFLDRVEGRIKELSYHRNAEGYLDKLNNSKLFSMKF